MGEDSGERLRETVLDYVHSVPPSEWELIDTDINIVLKSWERQPIPSIPTIRRTMSAISELIESSSEMPSRVRNQSEALISALDAERRARVGQRPALKMTDDELALSDLIRSARERAGLSQREVADALGISTSGVNLIENAKRRVSAMELVSLAITLRTPLESLVPNDQSAAELRELCHIERLAGELKHFRLSAYRTVR